MPESDPSPSFMDLAKVHEGLMELLLCHQDLMVMGELKRARAKFEEFVAGLQDHILKEETYLLPIFSDRVDAQLGCTPELLTAEHRKLERLFQETLDSLTSFENIGEVSPRERVIIIEKQHMLKEVLKHHDERERAAFFPNLDCAIQGEERQEVMRKVGLL
ncbi:MAG TPA: hemerythrin domain-containing protein [Planctomycetota bacterium]|jgi:hemerythrin-like domain-containing protein|nr:hypothetical protein [Planctomycetota bacterium]MDP7245328.1 hemerythrin domain-containing protein [Planctomycetota bacterium]HJM39928.1 hemerythrin domain-containing protein [Planctomycetota bacterium]